MNVQIVLLMAGAGTRFARAGYTESKPLVLVDGVPMFQRALSGLQAVPTDRIVAVVRRQQIEEEAIDRHLHDVRPDVEIVELQGMTRGAAESALAAVGVLDPDRPVIVLDCDLQFHSAAYERSLRSWDHSPCDALLLTFVASDSRYSFALVSEDGVVETVAEKQVISDRAIAGAYAFSSAAGFCAAASRVVERGERAGVPELYMSEVVLDVLDRGGRVLAAPVDEYDSFGTPEELHAFLAAAHA